MAAVPGLKADVDDRQRSPLHISPRQAEILALIANGRADKEIAFQLGISHRTVRTHIERLFRLHGWRSRAEAASTWATLRASHLVVPAAR